MDKNLEWQDLQEEELYRAYVFSLWRSKRANNTGYTSDFYYLQSPDWVNILAPISHQGKTCLLAVLQQRHGSKEMSLEFPGGIVEKGESIEACAERELLEECGYRAKKFYSIGKVYSNPALLNNQCHTVFAEGASYVGEQEKDPGELLRREYIPIDDLRQGRYPEHFTHALMFTALALYLGRDLGRDLGPEQKEGADRTRTGE